MRIQVCAFEFWTVEDSGFSNGISWFKTDRRFASFEEAHAYALRRQQEVAPGVTQWRVVHTQVTTGPNTRITTETYTPL